MAQNKNHHVPNGKNLKQLILECSQEQGFERVGAREIRTLEAALRRRMGNGNKVSPSYIANVLRQAGARVEVDDPFVDPWMEEPYASRLAGLLQFGDLEEAESSLRKLDAVFQEYRAAADRHGTDLVRSLIVKGKQRAETMAANPRVRPGKRREKQEIARWFKVWMDVSDLCFDWIEMRKESEEFRQTFGGPNGHRKSAHGEN
jgi:Domain of unknown function (DUF4385)